MALNEVSNLKSDILFGSSNCSCNSCESILCFTKRSIKPNECRCNICNEPNSCTILTKKDYLNKNYNVNGPHDQIKYRKPNEVNLKSMRNVDSPKARENDNLEAKSRNKNVTVQITPKHIFNTTIKYKSENQQSLTSNNQVSSHSPLGNIVNKLLSYNEISVNDIVDKIKGIYNSCSLKICECASLDNTLCKCKPCECLDCKKFLEQSDHSIARQINPLGNLTKPYSEQTCKCKPSDCEKCKYYSFKIQDKGETFTIKKTLFEPSIYRNKTSKNFDTKQICSCKPCQCSQCKSTFRVQNNVVVGSVEEYLHQNDCTCLPCNCNNCRQLGIPIAHNLMHEMSTDMVENTNCLCDHCLNHSCRQTIEPCRCESRNSVINKPFVKDTQNIDIHRAVVMKKCLYNKSNQTCTVSINIIEGSKKKAEIKKSNDYTNDKSSTKVCECEELNSLTSFTIKDETKITCDCDPCVCKICDKYKTVGNGVWKTTRFRSKCNCDICHCLYCSALLNPEEIESENKNIQMPANLINPGYRVTLNVNQAAIPPYIQGLRNARTKLQKQNAKVNKETCLNNKEELGSVRTRSIKNISLQIHAAPSSGNIGYKINNYLTQLPNVKYQPSSAVCENFSRHSKIDKTLVKTFVNEIMNIDEVGRFNLISGSSSSQNVSYNNVDNSLTSLWSFPEEIRTQTKVSLANIIDTKFELSEPKELSVDDNSKYSQKHRQNSILNKIKDLNDPCIICGMCTFYKKSTETKSDGRIQSIRHCFAKTDIAMIDHDKESIQIINKDKENNKCMEMNIPSEKDIIDEKSKVNSITVDAETLVGLTWKYCNDYFEKRNILRKAKLLTSELLKTIDKCEKENNEFENSTKEITNICDENLKNEKLLQTKKSSTNLNLKYSRSRLACTCKNLNVGNLQNYSKIAGEVNNQNCIYGEETMINMREKSQEKDNSRRNLNTDNYKHKDSTKVFKDLSSKTTLPNMLSQDNNNTISFEKARKSDNLIKVNKSNYKIRENRDKHNEYKGDFIIQSISQNGKEKVKKSEEKTDSFHVMNEVVVCPPRGEIKREMIKSIYDNCDKTVPQKCLVNIKQGQKCLKCGSYCFKVNSLSLRKISAHTVFIKWDKPGNMSCVQGYELFVDGRIVKKIYNPALTMAVVTCLPKSEKILFTIQTLTDPPTGHHSRASMVYYQYRKLNNT